MNTVRSSTRAAWVCSALLAAAVSAHAADGIETFTSGAPFFKRVVTNTNVNLTSNTVFANVPGATTSIFVPAQTTVLVSVDFAAEAACYGGGAQPNWCELQVLIGGVEGSPQASTFGGDTYAFASTDEGKTTANSWRGHALSRHRCITNTGNAPLQVPVAVQWKQVQFGADASTFWLDDSAMVVQMSRSCTRTLIPAGVSRQEGGAPTAGQR